MSFKLNTRFLLPQLGVLRLSGTDAVAFAQAQFMNDLRPLTVGHWQWNGWLSAKGRVQALFPLLRSGEQELCALLSGEPEARAALAAALQRFVFRAKVTLSFDPSRHVLGEFVASDSTPPGLDGSGLRHSAAGEVGLALHGTPARQLWLSEQPADADLELTRRWRLADIAAGIPCLQGPQADAWTPHMLALDRLDAFSVKKGCYPGQEIVARTHFLGQSKRSLTHIASRQPLHAGDEILSDGRAIGTVVSAEQDDDHYLGLAVLPSELPSEITVHAAAVAATALPARTPPVSTQF